MVGQEPPGGLRRVIRDEHGTLLRAAEPFTARANGDPAITAGEVTVNQQGEFVVVGLDFEEPAAAEAFDASLWTYLEQFYLRVAPAGDELSGLVTCSAPSRIRTCGLLLRRESLYPAELSGLRRRR
jgi:hypothetical protein